MENQHGFAGKRGDFCRTRAVFNIFCRGGRLCPPSKFVVFSWLFAGADAHLGAKSRALRGCASKLACGRRIGPLKCCDFASDFHKSGQFRRADRVVRPYGVKIETLYNNAHPPPRGGVSVLEGGSMWASTPTAWNHNSTDRRKTTINRAFPAGRCGHRPLRGGTTILRICPTFAKPDDFPRRKYRGAGQHLTYENR